MTDPDDLPPDDIGVDGDAVERVLEEMLVDAEQTVARLRHELATRRRSAELELTAAQHAEVNRLAEHLDRARIHWSEVRAFFDEALGELRHHEAQPEADAARENDTH